LTDLGVLSHSISVMDLAICKLVMVFWRYIPTYRIIYFGILG